MKTKWKNQVLSGSIFQMDGENVYIQNRATVRYLKELFKKKSKDKT